MAEFMYNPETLAEALDALVSGVNVGRDEVLLQTAERVLNLPPLTLSAEAATRIEGQVLDAFKKLPPAQPPFPRWILPIVFVIMLVIGAIVVATRPSIIAPPSTATSTVAPSSTMTPTTAPSSTSTATVAPSSTSTATVTPTSTNESTETATLTQTPIASATATTLPSQTTIATANTTATTSTNALPSGTQINLIIEGAVESITGNVIVIYNIEIRISDDDPLLGVIQVGDVIRIEGNIDAEGLAIAAVNVIFVNFDVVVGETGDVWRDNGNCDNPPPAWAPANGWRRRCEGGNGNGNGNGNGSGGN